MMTFMRTTLTLDDDLAQELHEASRKSGESFKAVVNTTLRRGLRLVDKPARSLPPFVVQAREFEFQPGIDIFRLNQLHDDLEIEDFRRKLTKAPAKR